ncbi:MAG TPA: class I SAM-dependent methyltransferase [Firmicutes bacterium]|nr:class I SAM-dependent methyltransferase [Bacillota bacterium]
MEINKDAELRRLYKDLAWLWQIISPAESYVKETEFIIKMINIYAKRNIQTLLHLGCGGGHHDFTFKRFLKVTGVDISDEMLYFAKKLNKEVHYLNGDIRDLRLEEKYDVVAILDSIVYMKTEDELLQAFRTAHEHLEPGGVFVTLCKISKENFFNELNSQSIHIKGTVEVVSFKNFHDHDPRDTFIEGLYFFIIRENKKVKVEIDQHIFGIFSIELWKEMLKSAGFEVNIVEFNLRETKLPMFICIKK